VRIYISHKIKNKNHILIR